MTTKPSLWNRIKRLLWVLVESGDSQGSPARNQAELNSHANRLNDGGFG